MKKFLVLLQLFASALLLLIGPSSGQLLQARSEASKTLPFVRTSSKSGDIRNDPSLPWRLPQNIKPSRYEVDLIPILDEDVEGLGVRWTVPGSVKIHLAAHDQPTNRIILHVNDIQLMTSETTLNKLDDNSIVKILGMTLNQTTNFLTLELEKDLEINVPYVLRFIFVSQLREEFHGMYRSSYIDPETNATKWIAITQMEALHARELFPCFDEPSFKAVFSTKIGRKDDQIALTNGPSIGNESIPHFPGWTWETFGDTVPMSTYLFAAVISEYGYSEAPSTILPDTVVRTYAPKHHIQRQGGVYPSEKAALILKDFETRFGQKYPLAKMDLASVTDFTFGAMENFGLNIYQQQLLLLFSDETTENERGRLTQILAHELAHQWFGNLVSPGWWTYIWLNEGISTFVQFVGLEAVVPEFKSWDLFIDLTLQRALAYDAIQATSHPLKIPEERWAQQDAMSWFDVIAYQKGGSIARMMEGFLTPPVFLQGLKTYQENKYLQDAVQDDLFEALDVHATGKLPANTNVSQVMSGWTLQSGFPLLQVSVNDANKIDVTQTKYKEPNSPDIWVVPVSVASKDNPEFGAEPEYWLTGKALTLNEAADKWVILNAGLTGYYRVLYNDALERLILEQLQQDHDVIHSHSRSQLLDDYFNFVWDGQSGVVIQQALAFTKYMSTKAETEMVVWTPLLKHLEHYLNTFGGTGMLEDLKAYLLPRIKASITASGGYDKIDQNSKGIDVMSHTQLLDWACALDDPDCLAYAATSIDTWKTDIRNNPINRDLKPVLYCAATRKDKSYGEFLRTEYSGTTNGLSPAQKTLLLRAFHCIDDGPMIRTLLEETLTENLFKTKADAATFLQSLASNYKVRDHLVSFIMEKTADIMTWFGADTGKSVLTSVVSSLSNFMSTTSELEQIETFASENENIFNGALNTYINKIKGNIDLIEKFGKPMQQFFKDNPVNNSGNSIATFNYLFITFALSFVLRLL